MPEGGAFRRFAVEFRACFESATVTVGQPAVSATTFRVSKIDASGVAHPATSVRFGPPSLLRPGDGPRSQSAVTGVGQPDRSPVQPLSDVRRADARSAQIGGPDGIAQVLQVSAYSGEPRPAVRACSLLAKHRWRSALRDEALHVGPEVVWVGDRVCAPGAEPSPVVGVHPPSASDAESLARAGSGPDWGVVGDAGEPEREAPPADPCKEVDLSKPFKVSRSNVANRTDIHVPRSNKVCRNQFPKPRSVFRIVLIIVRSHGASMDVLSTT